MINALRPSGTLIAALALWSLCLVILAFAGLGAQVGLHPSNPALAPPLPAVQLDAVGSRLGPHADYSEIAARPLLSRDRRPAAIVAAGSADSEAPLDANLTSVLIAGEFKMAILQANESGKSFRVRIGDVMEGTAWRLVELQPRGAVFEGPQGRRELELRVFDGQGGAAPTPLTTVAPPAPRPGPSATGAAPAVAATPSSSEPGVVQAAPEAAAAPISPEQQVEAIRRRIEARRAMRAAQAQQDQSGPAAPPEQVQ